MDGDDKVAVDHDDDGDDIADVDKDYVDADDDDKYNANR